VFDVFKNHRRARFATRRSEGERMSLEANVPYVTKLDAADRKELEGLTRVFLAENSFEGCGGLVLPDARRRTIAVQACLLLPLRETDIYPRSSRSSVYPGA
jgi:Mlc titration factor MtfA (ptsG expression regulator)